MGIKAGGGEGMQSPVARSTSTVVSLSRTAPNNGRNSGEGSLRSKAACFDPRARLRRKTQQGRTSENALRRTTGDKSLSFYYFQFSLIWPGEMHSACQFFRLLGARRALQRPRLFGCAQLKGKLPSCQSDVCAVNRQNAALLAERERET